MLTRTQHTLQALLANANRDIASLLDAQQASDAALASTRAELHAARAENLRLRQQLSLRPDDKQATPHVESGGEVAQVDQAEMRDLEEKLVRTVQWQNLVSAWHATGSPCCPVLFSVKPSSASLHGNSDFTVQKKSAASFTMSYKRFEVSGVSTYSTFGTL